MGRTNSCYKKQWVAPRVSNNGLYQGCEGTTNLNMIFGKLKMFLLYPSTTFRQVQEGVGIGTRESPRHKSRFFEIDPTVGVPSTFGFANFNFQEPERCAFLSETW